jgi:2-polyprenyl-3-methyl-5-hydroxy-6-metoxy-1,4-benzoquinol methylase
VSSVAFTSRLERLTPFLILLGILVLHDYFSNPHRTLHIGFLPIIALPVAYLSSVYGLRGVLLAAALSVVIVSYHLRDWHTGVVVSEVALLGAITALGAVMASVSSKEQENLDQVARGVDEYVRSLTGSPGYWDRVASTKMGLYVTRTESEFIDRSLRDRKLNALLDVGSGSGRLEATLLRHSRLVIATEIDADALSKVPEHRGLHPVLVSRDASTLPVGDKSLDAVVCIEAPAASDTAWFRAECARTIKPGGSVIVLVHNALSYKGLVTRMRAAKRKASGVKWAELYYQKTLSKHVASWQESGFKLRSTMGFYWAPLKRDSNSSWVNVMGAMERVLGLRRLAGWSPWVLVELQIPR